MLGIEYQSKRGYIGLVERDKSMKQATRRNRSPISCASLSRLSPSLGFRPSHLYERRGRDASYVSTNQFQDWDEIPPQMVPACQMLRVVPVQMDTPLLLITG